MTLMNVQSFTLASVRCSCKMDDVDRMRSFGSFVDCVDLLSEKNVTFLILQFFYSSYYALSLNFYCLHFVG